ncbi:unnamed protein product [Rhizoctonia solani]|uniref:Uncharacterized protein n=1 Tax=Rhizoctonia solani TaxID=456999 RepID=A0A8H3CPZ1_9AGAM|nr:unnamed protein product [Rhizoctonia solani]
MSVDLDDLNLRAWVVDSERRPLPHFNHRRIAPHTIESWIPSTAGESFSIYFNGRNKSPGQDVLDIHAVAELDGRLKLDGVILPAAQRAAGQVGGILDQPVSEGKARPLKFGKLRVTDEDDEGNRGEHVNIIKVRLEWGRFREIHVLDKFRNPTNRGTAHEHAVKDGNSASTILGRKMDSPVVSLCKFEPDERFEPQTFIFRYASREWLRNHTQFLSPAQLGSSEYGYGHSQRRQQSEDLRAEGIDNPPGRLNSEREPTLLEHENYQTAIGVKNDPDVGLHTLDEAATSGNELPESRGRKQRYPLRSRFISQFIIEEDHKNAVLQPIRIAQNKGSVSNESTGISGELELEVSSDDNIEFIKHVVPSKNKRKKRHTGALGEGSIKKRLKSEDFTEPVSSTGQPGLSMGQRDVDRTNVKIEPTD